MFAAGEACFSPSTVRTSTCWPPSPCKGKGSRGTPTGSGLSFRPSPGVFLLCKPFHRYHHARFGARCGQDIARILRRNPTLLDVQWTCRARTRPAAARSQLNVQFRSSACARTCPVGLWSATQHTEQTHLFIESAVCAVCR